MFGSSCTAPFERRAQLRALFTRLPALVAVDVVPLIDGLLLGRVRVGVAADADAGVVPEETVVGLEHGLAVAGQVVDEPEARGRRIPGVEVRLGERLRGHPVGQRGESGRPLRQRSRQLLLLGQVAVVTVEAHAHVDGGAAEGPRVVEEHARLVQARDRRELVVRAQLAGIGRGRERELHLARHAV